jgi:hypothetical protein
MRLLKQQNLLPEYSSLISLSLAYMSLVRPILECGASCWYPNREDQINASDCVQKKTAKFANHTNDLVWETMSQRMKIARICALFKIYTGERTWKSTWNRLKWPYYRSRDDHDRKIWARKHRTDIGKYCCVFRTIKLWNQLTAEALGSFHYKSHIFRNRFRKVIISVEKGRVFEVWWRKVQKCSEMKNWEWSVVKCSEMK